MPIDFEADAIAMTSADDFGEACVYHKRGGEAAGGEDRDFNAIVDRESVSTVEGMEMTHMPQLFIECPNSETDGISSDELDTILDYVAVAVKYGDEPSIRQIKALVYHDQGIIRLELR